MTSTMTPSGSLNFSSVELQRDFRKYQLRSTALEWIRRASTMKESFLVFLTKKSLWKDYKRDLDETFSGNRRRVVVEVWTQIPCT